MRFIGPLAGPALRMDDPRPIGAPAGPESTRSLRQPMFKVPPATAAIVGALSAIFAAISLGPDGWADAALSYFSLVPTRFEALAGRPFWPYWPAAGASLLSYAVIHIDPLHFVMNIGFLLAFGTFCERALGPRRYIALIVGGALAGGLTQVVADWGDVVLIHGASGAVFASFGGMIRVMIGHGADRRRRRLAIRLTVVMMALNLALGLAGPGFLISGASIAWEAHIGGFIAGFVLARRTSPRSMPGA